MIHFNQIVEFEPRERESYRAGDLREEWARVYPQLFDEDDVRIARSQPNYHFYEWFAAIFIFSKTGELSLVEQYQFPSHKRKRLIVAQLMSPALLKCIETAAVQAPDLLVYASDFSAWHFCEVKGPRDKLSSKQRDCFARLELITEKPVYVLRLRERVERRA